MAEGIAEGRGGRARLSITLLVLSLAQFVIALDYSIIYVALPEIAGALQLADAHAQWIVSAYGVIFAGFLLAGGRLCDAVGAKNMFIIAMALFSLASLLGGVTTSAHALIVARGVQGLGAALLQPAIIALISHHFRPGRARARALTVWSAVGAAGLVAGVVLGGLFAQFSWRLVFLVNVPPGLACIWSARRYFLVVVRPTTRQSLPLMAAVLATLSVLSIVLAMTSLAGHGLNHIDTHRWFGASAVFILLFWLGEKYGGRPLVAHGLRRLASLRRGSIASALYMASVGSELFLLTVLMQNHYGYSALLTGLVFIPLTLMIIVGNAIAGRLFSAFAAVRVLRWGFLAGGVGLLLILYSLEARIVWPGFIGGLLLSGVGHGMIYTAKFVVGMHEVPDEQQGVASGLMITAQYASGAVAVALIVVILNAWSGMAGFHYAFAALTGFALLGALLTEDISATV
ncbi:MFS transporter [Affinibrenneria salicis]|uniref:MFS transporter n=1 Tax=Affinibrenneria salicis TaxID=2590031 RepID=A0A5J5FY46_9GAMM|nr:MFS transporter [Affinibrenneria salicis]KAA8998853.1 MFS transporter [Affinibrenneria salicis]